MRETQRGKGFFNLKIRISHYGLTYFSLNQSHELLVKNLSSVDMLWIKLDLSTLSKKANMSITIQLTSFHKKSVDSTKTFQRGKNKSNKEDCFNALWF